jgi:hypothetical protein
MGCESRLYIVNKTRVGVGSDFIYGEVVAILELGCLPSIRNYMDSCGPTDCYFYNDDGNTRVTEDKYGQPLTESPIGPIIDILEREVEDKKFFGDYYRRIEPALAMLKSFADNIMQWDNLKVLQYKH